VMPTHGVGPIARAKWPIDPGPVGSYREVGFDGSIKVNISAVTDQLLAERPRVPKEAEK
jgi:hypothetical protein